MEMLKNRSFKRIIIFSLLAIFLLNNLNSNFVSKYENIINSQKLISKIHISEENYESDMKNIVEPYLNELIISGIFNGVSNKKIYYEKYTSDNNKGNIVISHGYTESLDKYHEMIYYFLKAGFNVFGIEHRGHGRSESLGIEDKSQMYVENYEDYIIDLKTFMDKIVIPAANEKHILLFSHSMGGAIGIRFIELYPDYFNAAVLSSPMLSVNTGSIPNFLVSIIAKIAINLKRGGIYVIGFNKYYKEENMDEWATSSKVRYEYYNSYVNENEQFQKGGASYKWLNEALELCEEVTEKKNITNVKIPILLFQAGNDVYVTINGQKKMKKYVKNCTLIKIESSRHEIYREVDKIQIPYLIKVLDFCDNNI